MTHTDKGSLHTRATDKGDLQTKGPYRQGALTDKELIYRQGALQIKDPYRRCAIPSDKELLQTIWGPYRQLVASTDNYGPLQTRGPIGRCCAIPTDKGPLQKGALTDQGPIQTRDPYMIYRKEAPTGRTDSYRCRTCVHCTSMASDKIN